MYFKGDDQFRTKQQGNYDKKSSKIFIIQNINILEKVKGRIK